MNERIKELAEQAGYEKDMFGIGHWDMPECKKFAELILQDCMSICEELGADFDCHYAADAISRKFGV